MSGGAGVWQRNAAQCSVPLARVRARDDRTRPAHGLRVQAHQHLAAHAGCLGASDAAAEYTVPWRPCALRGARTALAPTSAARIGLPSAPSGSSEMGPPCAPPHPPQKYKQSPTAKCACQYRPCGWSPDTDAVRAASEAGGIDDGHGGSNASVKTNQRLATTSWTQCPAGTRRARIEG